MDEDSLFDIRLCAEEALRNAIVHGNLSDRRKPVKVSIEIGKGEVIIEIEDEGKGFNPALLPDPTAGDNIMKAAGRGVYLVKRLMDKVEFNETGNRIRMVKRFKMEKPRA